MYQPIGLVSVDASTDTSPWRAGLPAHQADVHQRKQTRQQTPAFGEQASLPTKLVNLLAKLDTSLLVYIHQLGKQASLPTKLVYTSSESRAHLPAMLVDTSMAGSGGLYLPARGQCL
ncbi:hypothetical protein PCASD_06063 [Puccinia coronata f. sp. avenae]|uniref:Uncharacterized protein n=1 Tax=Puccinia coronata f. sp. avenae TaxID=200324 RepID=A0A2N5UZB6_9BASI|nr:hypothetical protein PCASD_06063 [Puccinia coronata f. sp. avenae]